MNKSKESIKAAGDTKIGGFTKDVTLGTFDQVDMRTGEFEIADDDLQNTDGASKCKGRHMPGKKEFQ